MRVCARSMGWLYGWGSEARLCRVAAVELYPLFALFAVSETVLVWPRRYLYREVGTLEPVRPPPTLLPAHSAGTRLLPRRRHIVESSRECTTERYPGRH